MTLVRISLIAAAVASLSTAVSAAPVTRVLGSLHENFRSDGRSARTHAELDNAPNIEVFSHDYADNLYVPAGNYSAYLTPIISGSDLSKTGFGSFSSRSAGNINSQVSGPGTDQSIMNPARYEVAAYLVSQYNRPSVTKASFGSDGNYTYDEGIGQSIRDILAPYSVTPSFSSSTKGSPGHDSLLSSFHPGNGSFGGPNLAGPSLPGPITVVPEPRHLALMLIGLLLLGSGLFRKHLRAGRSGV